MTDSHNRVWPIYFPAYVQIGLGLIPNYFHMDYSHRLFCTYSMDMYYNTIKDSGTYMYYICIMTCDITLCQLNETCSQGYDTSKSRMLRILFHHSIDPASGGGVIQLLFGKSTAIARCMHETIAEFSLYRGRRLCAQ